VATEIERKFLVSGDTWRSAVVSRMRIRQAYLTRKGRCSVRVRLTDSQLATLTVKTAGGGLARHEYEYDIPRADAEEMLPYRDGAVIEKVRHIIPAGDLKWEIDVFAGESAGLILAEIELQRPDQEFRIPGWLGTEVTGDRRYYNADLAANPFMLWGPAAVVGERFAPETTPR
jgi:adenylate cyclase